MPLPALMVQGTLSPLVEGSLNVVANPIGTYNAGPVGLRPFAQLPLKTDSNGRLCIAIVT